MRRCLVLALAAVAALTACRNATKSGPPSLSEPIIVSDGSLGSILPNNPIELGGPAIAVGFDGTNYLVAWAQQGSTTVPAGIFGARVSASGQLLDPQAFVICAAPNGGNAPAVSFDGTNYLVAWEDHRNGQYLNIYAARVSPAGAVLDPNGIALAPETAHQYHPAIAFDGTNHLVVWQDRRSDPTWDIYAARVSPAGAVLDRGGFAVSQGYLHQTTPAVAFDGTNHLVVWQDQRSDTGDIYGARVTPAGAVLDPNGIAVAKAPGLQASPAVASVGGASIVVWQDLRNGTDLDIYAVRVAADGSVGTAAAVAVAPGAQQAPAIAFDGIDVFVAWEDGRSGTEYDVYGARLDATATLLDATPFLLASATGGYSVAVASDRAGRGMVAYDPLDAAGIVRLAARLFTDWAKVAVTKAGKGGGTVASSPAGIACGATCSAPFDAPTSVTLTAQPDGDSAFGGWSGDCTGAADCTVTVDGPKNVVATFLPLYPVNVTIGSVPGTVTSTPAGISCGGTCSARYVEGTAVTLAAAGSPGVSVFGSWSGDCTGTGPCTITVDGPKSVTASFVAAYTLTLTATGGGSLSVGNASCTNGSCPVDFAAGSTVTIAANPDASSILKSWSGCPSPAATSCTVDMTYARYVSAQFQPKTYPLMATIVGGGIGTITGGNLSCTSGSTAGCTSAIPNPPFSSDYTTVTLTATADSATSVFKQWYGCTPLADNPEQCTVWMRDARTVTAKFEPKAFTVTAAPTGSTGTISGPNGLSCTTGSSTGCVASIDNPPDTSSYNAIALQASPGTGAVFKKWGSGCVITSDAPRTCGLTMSTSRSVSATFEPSTYTLTTTTLGTGAGTISGIPGLSCTSGSTFGCSVQVDNPADTTAYQTVTINAQPVDANSVFKTWSGCVPVDGNPASCMVTMMMARYVSAKFEPSTFPLTAQPYGTGTGTISGAGLSCRTGATNGCNVAVANPANTGDYQTVTLHAAADAGSVFKTWSGCTAVDGDPSSCTVRVSSAASVSAKFEPSTFPLTGTFGGLGGGTITLPGGVTCTPTSSGCSVAIDNPALTNAYTTVTVTAQPDSSSIFKGWSGCTPVDGNPTACTVVVSSARTVMANFDPSTYALTQGFRGTGGGIVTGAGLACTSNAGAPSGTCTTTVANGDTAVLTAAPDANSIFAGWSGCTLVSGTTCSVAMTSARTVYATFQPSTYALTVYLSGSGGGTVSGDQISCTTGAGTAGCSEMAANGSTVTLTAKPDASSIFKGWSGCTTINADGSCSVTMTSAKYVYATFQPSTYTLTVYPSGSGSGTVTSQDLAISCTTGSSSSCSATEPNGSTVVLTAQPATGSAFTGWGACPNASGNTCTVPMTTSRTIYAYFQPSP